MKILIKLVCTDIKTFEVIVTVISPVTSETAVADWAEMGSATSGLPIRCVRFIMRRP